MQSAPSFPGPSDPPSAAGLAPPDPLAPLTFTIVTLSECFPGGADPSEADLTPRGFKNGMRFWFRALMGKVVGGDREALKRLELRVFGGAGDGSGDGSWGSPFSVELGPPSVALLPPGGGKWPEASLRRYTPRQEIGYRYLAFSLIPSGRNPGRHNVLPVGSRFQLRLRFRRPEPYVRRVVRDTLWLLAHFGGIGARTRRTFGAFRITDPYFALPVAEPHRRIEERLREIEEHYRTFAGPCAVPTPPLPTALAFTSFARWGGRLIVDSLPARRWDSIFDLQRDLGERLREFRKTALVGTFIDQDSGGPGRRASPLFVRPRELEDGRLAALVVVFPAPYRPAAVYPLPEDIADDAERLFAALDAWAGSDALPLTIPTPGSAAEPDYPLF